MAAGAQPYVAGHLAEGIGNMVGATPFGIPIALADLIDAKRRGDDFGVITGMAGLIPGAKGVIRPAASKKLILPGEQLFDLSRSTDLPKVPQFDLPRSQRAAGVPQRILDVVNDPGVHDKMRDIISRGRQMGGHTFYYTEPLEEQFLSLLGKRYGADSFNLYLDLLGATTSLSPVGINIRNASYYYKRFMSQEGVPAIGQKNPYPYGHPLEDRHKLNVMRVLNGGMNPLTSPKSVSFAENLRGNLRPVSIDSNIYRQAAMLAQDPRFLKTAYQASKGAPVQNIQKMLADGEITMEEALKTPAYWQGIPRRGEYGRLEKHYQGLADEVALPPAQGEGAAWSGGGHLTGMVSDANKSFLQVLNDRINLTAAARGETPLRTMRTFILGKEPLLSLGVAGAGLGAMAPGPSGRPDSDAPD